LISSKQQQQQQQQQQQRSPQCLRSHFHLSLDLGRTHADCDQNGPPKTEILYQTDSNGL